MQVLPTVPSPTTTHLIGRPLDILDQQCFGSEVKKIFKIDKIIHFRILILQLEWGILNFYAGGIDTVALLCF